MLSKKTKYAINALVYLARIKETDEPVQISKIAESEHIPRKFLEAILLDLKHAGILNSRKGKTGGYYLQKTAEEINMADVCVCLMGLLQCCPVWLMFIMNAAKNVKMRPPAASVLYFPM